MPEPGQLSVNDRVLLHISRFATDIEPEEYPPDCTQAGIAVAVGISRTHVPRSVKGLMKEGFVTELTARVRGHERRMSVYTVSTEGLRAADSLWRTAQTQEFSVLKDGSVIRMTGRSIEEKVGRKMAIAAISQMRDGVLTIEERRRSPVRALEDAPHLDRFYGREAELESMDRFMDSDSRILVVLGNKGYGTTALTRKFVESQDEEDVLWVGLSERTTVEDIEGGLVRFGRRIDKSIQDPKGVLGLDNALLIFDDYFSASEGVVEFFGWLVENAGAAKVIINARQETPAYNWFYRRKNVDSGIVQELRIKGLDAASSRRLIGNDRIEPDALKRIMMITHGQPMVLRMLREEDQKGLKKNTLFTPEEIRYLLFLKAKVE